jgi:hypothetical protein
MYMRLRIGRVPSQLTLFPAGGIGSAAQAGVDALTGCFLPSVLIDSVGFVHVLPCKV